MTLRVNVTHRKSDVAGVNAGRSINAFLSKILFILFIILQLANLVICGDPDDDSLQNALEFVERRQRDLQLQDNDYYGQPEDIGYGYQKNFGIFDNEPATELGSPDSNPESVNDFRNVLYNYMNYQRDSDYDGGYNKRASGIQQRYAKGLVGQRENENGQEGGSDIRCTYVRTLKDLWCRYRQSQQEDVNLEDLTPEQVTMILTNLYDKYPTKEDGDSYDSDVYNDNTLIPLRSRRNYRVFDRLKEKRRYPSFGEGFYGKRSSHSQYLNRESPNENEFLYALKFVNPDMNREAVENLKEGGYDVFGDEKDRDVMRILDEAVNNPRVGQEEEAYWTRKEEPYDEVWLPGPISYQPDETFQDLYNDKRTAPKIFKPHNGIHLNNKRIPVKRSSMPAKESTTGVPKEVKNIFKKETSKMTTTATTAATTMTPEPKKKEITKKPTEMGKKVNTSKTEVGKKKIVRRANDYTKEEVYPSSEIDRIFNVQKINKKSIDWSQYFGYDKRSQKWLLNDSIRKAENHFLTPKSKRYMNRENADNNRYEAPFDTRIFNSKKKLSMDKNIDTMERKLGNIEERIIDDAVKFTGAHTGTGNEDMRKVKNEIVHHLEAAYSLEKMKNALEEFKNSMKSEKSFSGAEEVKKTATESPKSATTARSDGSKTKETDTEKSKRVSTKKEIEDVYGKDSLEFLNWPSKEQISDQSEGDEECPILEKSLNNCLKVDEIGGRYSELLLPICSLHQICYMCISEIKFSKPSACDLMYLTEAENLCQGNRRCLLSARDSMLALRDIHEQEILSGDRSRSEGSCLLNQCVQRYFMNSPAAVVPLEFQD